MRTTSPLDRATDQLAGGAADTADLVADVLTDAAHNAVDLAADVAADIIADGGEAIAAMAAGGIARRLKRPQTLVAVLVVALVGAWLYRRFSGGDESS